MMCRAPDTAQRQIFNTYQALDASIDDERAAKAKLARNPIPAIFRRSPEPEQ